MPAALRLKFRRSLKRRAAARHHSCPLSCSVDGELGPLARLHACKGRGGGACCLGLRHGIGEKNGAAVEVEVQDGL